MIIRADARHIPLADESVHCVVTSPPYWSLRAYEGIEPMVWDGEPECEHEWGSQITVNATNHTDKRRWNHTRNGRDELQPKEKRVSWLRTELAQGCWCQHCGAWRGMFGLEPTPDLYVRHMVQIFREVWRVLRPDGMVWLNLGDCYATGAGKVGECPGGGHQGERWRGYRGQHGADKKRDRRAIDAPGKTLYWEGGIGPMVQPNRMPLPGLKPKDLCGIPWRVALALQANGWWLRSDIIWSKPNPMPESVTDRPTRAHEYLFLLTKREKYFYDAVAIAESSKYPEDDRKARASISQKRMPSTMVAGVRPGSAIYPTRNKRTVWEITTQQPTSFGNYDFSGADYVDDHGIPHRWSQDCPVHEQDGQLQLRSRVVVSYDAQGELIQSGSGRKIGDLGQEPSVAGAPTAGCKKSLALDSPSDAGSNSILGNRIFDENHAEERERLSRKRCTQSSPARHKRDSDFPADSNSATLHNTEMSRSGPGASGCPSSDRGVDEIVCHTLSMEFPESSEATHIPVSNSEGAGLDSSSPWLAFRTAHTQSARSCNDDKCKCRISQVAHFATFPEALVQPCIAAGTSEHGCCAKCGAPWERSVERERVAKVMDYHGKNLNQDANFSHRRLLANVRALRESGQPHDNPFPTPITIGWKPTCRCDCEARVPATVLDPFSGSGTVGEVAFKMGRRFVCLDVSEPYVNLMRQRIPPMAFLLGTPSGVRQCEQSDSRGKSLIADHSAGFGHDDEQASLWE